MIKCEMSALQRRLYGSLQQYGVVLSSQPLRVKLDTSYKALQNIMMQLRKLCCHPFLFPEVEKDLFQHLTQLEGAPTRPSVPARPAPWLPR